MIKLPWKRKVRPVTSVRKPATLEDAQALFMSGPNGPWYLGKVKLAPLDKGTRFWLKGGHLSNDPADTSEDKKRFDNLNRLLNEYRDKHIRENPWVIEEAKKIPPQEFLLFKFPKGTDASKEDIVRIESLVRLALQKRVDVVPAKRTLAGFSIDSVK